MHLKHALKSPTFGTQHFGPPRPCPNIWDSPMSHGVHLPRGGAAVSLYTRNVKEPQSLEVQRPGCRNYNFCMCNMGLSSSLGKGSLIA